MSEKQVQTWNGAPSYAEISNPLIELTFKSVRNVGCTDYQSIKIKEQEQKQEQDKKNSITLETYFDKAWAFDPERTLKYLFHLRDCREGKGEKKLFRAIIRHMRNSGLINHVKHNMKHIPHFGSWKDISLCFFGTSLEKDAVRMIADQLKLDLKSEKPSLCAKYAPSEKGAVSQKYDAANKIAKALGVTVRNYRKKYLVPLRSKLNIVETKMCAHEWNQIIYETVPSIAVMRYKKAFSKHDNQRYTNYLQKVVTGKTTMNTQVLMPHQIVSQYLLGGKKDDTIEAQWVSFLDDRRQKITQLNFLPIIDVSGSMFNGKSVQPIEVAMSLGILFSTLNTTPQYNGKFITFSSSPELLSISNKGTSLYEQVSYISKTIWTMTTDLQKVFDLILDIATMHSLTQDQLPNYLIILSDMQFNDTGSMPNWQVIEEKYTSFGYIRPKIIFWNLTGISVDFPVPHADVPNCILLSGYNDILMYSIIDNTDFSPAMVINSILDSDRYSQITLAPSLH